jgi:hypothetical protein
LLLNTEERRDKVRKLMADLDARFNELVWNHPAKLSKLQHYRPSVIPDFWKQYDELDERCLNYLEGKIEWEERALQLDFTEQFKIPFPTLHHECDVQTFARELYIWLALHVKDL